MSTKISVFDSSIWIDQWRTGCHAERIASIVGRIRLCSVVQAELWRGVIGQAEADLLKSYERNYAILTPTEKTWLESGLVLSRMRVDSGFSPEKLRDLHFDVLIALTARSHGARLITSNRTDFEFIRSYRDFELEAW